MLFLRLLTSSVALLLITSSNALSLDSSVHLARHQHIAARHPVVKRSSSSVSARCQKRNPTTGASSSTSLAIPIASPSSSSQAPLPSSSKAPSSSSGSSSSSSSSSRSKIGISWANGEESSLHNFNNGKISGIYNWSPNKPPTTDGLPFYPMLWGVDEKRMNEFRNVVKPGYADTVLAFNEPDLEKQSNIDPVYAAQVWMGIGQPLRAQGYKTIAPAIAFKKEWLQSFFKACKGCEWDAMAAHSYATDPQITINYLTDLHNTFNMPIWVTEFACQDFTDGPQANKAQVFAYMTRVTQWMEETDFIQKYFAYGFMTPAEININKLDSLMNSDGTPSALGWVYLGS